ncbi:MAG: hypothetical protein QMC67_05020 [Candidatus Wallbacteria bacterium]
MLKKLIAVGLVILSAYGTANADNNIDLNKRIAEIRAKHKQTQAKETLKNQEFEQPAASAKPLSGGLFYGYDKVKWGATLREVKSAYPEIKPDKDWTENEGVPNYVCYTEYMPEGNVVRKRYFFFRNDMLYKVLLDFNLDTLDNSDLFVKRIDRDVLSAITKRLEEQYHGKPILLSTKSGFNIFNDLIVKETYGWSLFGDKMHVVLTEVFNKGGSGGSRPIESLQVCSYVKSIENERSEKQTELNIKEKNLKVDF